MFSYSNEVVAETAKEGDINKRIYESWSFFRNAARERAPFSEQGYMLRRS